MDDPTLIDLPDQLVGERVIVRPYRPGDGQALYEGVNVSREHLKPWMPWAVQHQTPEESEALARKIAAKWLLREDLGVSIWKKDSGKYLGGSGLHRIDWDVRKFEVGYWIRSDEEGHGYVTEAVRLLCRMAFETLSANRVFIRCSTQNTRSAAIPKKLGFQLEGTMRNDIRTPDGKLHDTFLFSLTPQEWHALSDNF